MSTITMQELELETAELLPARETLWSQSHGPTSNFSQTALGLIATNANQSAQGGTTVGLLNVLDGNAINIAL
jgi:hypothetical protein